MKQTTCSCRSGSSSCRPLDTWLPPRRAVRVVRIQKAINVDEIIKTVDRASQSPIQTRTLLWVDDNPANNILERQAFEAAGYTITLARSTQEALARLETTKFTAIISNMGRPEGADAGYTLLDDLRGRGDKTPFFIYSTSNEKKYKREASERGAQGSTNDPNGLFQLVTNAK